jgi:hypothetical protein
MGSETAHRHVFLSLRSWNLLHLELYVGARLLKLLGLLFVSELAQANPEQRGP